MISAHLNNNISDQNQNFIERDSNSENELLPLSKLAVGSPYGAEYLSLLARRHKLPATKVDNVWYSTRKVLAEYIKKREVRFNPQDSAFLTASLPVQAPASLQVVPAVEIVEPKIVEEESTIIPIRKVELPLEEEKFEDDEGAKIEINKKEKIEKVEAKKYQTYSSLLSDDFVVPEVPQSFVTTSLFNKTLATALALLIVFSAGTSFYSKTTGKQVSFNLESEARNLAALPFAADIVEGYNSIFGGFKNLKDLALKKIFLTSEKVEPSSPKAKIASTPTTTTPTLATQTAVIGTSPTYTSEFARIELKAELENYVNTRLAQISPASVYNTYSPIINTNTLRDQILTSDTRPLVTRQSTSDSSRLSSAITQLANGGSLSDVLINGATISNATGNFTALSFNAATGTSATTTNIFSTNGTFTNLFSTGIDLASLTFTNATGTSATTTNFFATTASSTNLFASLANFGQATTTGSFAITGAGSGITFYGSGNHDITAASGSLRIGANTVIGNIEALDNTVDIGTVGTRFDKIYATEINATTLVGTIDGGNINAEALTINFDNVTNDTEDSYVAFERGSASPNALLTWDAANDRFTLNSDLALVGGIGNGSLLVNSSTTLQNFTGINATTTNATTTNSYFSNSLTGPGNFIVDSTGKVGIGTTTPSWLLSLYSSGGPQLALSDGAGVSQWTFRNSGGNLYLATTTTSGIATSSTSALTILNGGNIGVGTTTPWGVFSISPSLTNLGVPSLVIGSSTATHFLVSDTGSVGVGTVSPGRKLDVVNTASVAQFRLSQDGSIYTEFYTDSTGDMQISTTGGSVRLNNENLWVCSGGSCGVSTPVTKGNVIVETAVIFNNNFKLKQIDASTTIMYDTTDSEVLRFDEASQ